jgi:hypothetical protein
MSFDGVYSCYSFQNTASSIIYNSFDGAYSRYSFYSIAYGGYIIGVYIQIDL